MVRGLPFDNSKRPADHASLKPSAWSKHPATNMWMGSAHSTHRLGVYARWLSRRVLTALSPLVVRLL